MVQSVWDANTQTFHGGQEHSFLDNFVEDFSVTTNYLGTPQPALQAAKEAMHDIHHYPAANQEPAKSCLAEFLWPGQAMSHHGRLLLGNGASELIDLVVRICLKNHTGTEPPTWKGGPWNVQYQEYQRSANTNGFKVLPPMTVDRANMVCLVNPCNPTGDYMSIEPLKAWIKANVKTGGTVIVDESMQPWVSPDFRADSLISQHDFAKEMWDDEKVSVYVMHSWTKIWSCTGLRVGSVICPSDDHGQALRKIQVPWSVNGPALKFVEAVVKDEAYLKETWDNTTRLRAYLVDQLLGLNASWVIHGQACLSWVWVDMGSQEVADKAVALARAAGVPVRSGTPGYQCLSFVRVAVRLESQVDVLIAAWRSL
ncbi:PLP-dependent transferase [Hesseltinella vesiculosa]|uniref:PLP-dependent transferase n=1 Tax=Hesseltinella vesiculosa TaxID=101127 RepID=A0A1X2G9J6_9FUNG|nr:PLP-dependent transferase [Hesseltinella vesiculosa]